MHILIYGKIIMQHLCNVQLYVQMYINALVVYYWMI